MPAYHTEFHGETLSVSCKTTISGIGLLPFKTTVRGPIASGSFEPLLPHCTKDERIHMANLCEPSFDMVDEAIALFRVNSLFKHFEFKSTQDRLFVYLLLYIHELLAKVKSTMTKAECIKAWNTLNAGAFPMPGDSHFALNALYPPPGSKADADALKAYLYQLRQEVALRLITPLYPSPERPSKWWLAFQKRKFMNKTLSY